MADYKDRLEGYVQVNERIITFYEMYPKGNIESEIVEFKNAVFGPVEIKKRKGDNGREYEFEFWPVVTKGIVIVKARAFRDPEDRCPAIGHSSLEIPGSTPYTEGSELENAETSAWGRALAALGLEVKRGIATSNEIAAKRGPVPNEKKGKVKAKPDQELKGVEICRARGHHNTQKIIDAATNETTLACVDCGKPAPSEVTTPPPTALNPEGLAKLRELVESTKAPIALMVKQYAKGKKYEVVAGELMTDMTTEEVEKLIGVLENRKNLQESKAGE